jgi:hypothetical protein
MVSRLVHIPTVGKSSRTHYTRGRGVGAVLLDGGQGGQSSYYSVDDYIATTNAQVPVGSGLKGLENIRGKMENLMIKPKSRKPKNIKFSI